MNTEKHCRRCDRTRPTTEFYTNTTRPDNLSNYCKDCQRQFVREHYDNNKEYYYRKNSQRKLETRQWLFDLKRKPCTDCGYIFHPYIMEFDHRDPGTKTIDVAAISKIRDREVIKAEIAKCDLVCSNCHKLRTYKRRGIYREDLEIELKQRSSGRRGVESIRNVSFNQPNKATEYIGVKIQQRNARRKYTALIRFGGKQHYLGAFLTPLEAAIAYDNAAVDLRGDAERPNKTIDPHVRS